MKYLLYTLLWIPLLLWHCAGPQPEIGDETRPVPPLEQPSEDQNEDFDPMTLNDFELDVDSQPASSSVQVVDVEQLLRGDAVPDSLLEGQAIPGFRVQLIATRNEEEARAVMRNAVISFDEQVYRQYDNPYYKIRVGDFLSRYEANQLQEEAIALGFHEAWVVRSMIQSGSPSQEDEDNDMP